MGGGGGGGGAPSRSMTSVVWAGATLAPSAADKLYQSCRNAHKATIQDTKGRKIIRQPIFTLRQQFLSDSKGTMAPYPMANRSMCSCMCGRREMLVSTSRHSNKLI